ncbi:Phage polarity suppression protein encoded in CP-933I [Erwinia billingiae Eb661]|uniref:Phage polarity suppression protein encoded in CP-933I n=1 Tax=Erwinia billingiae (strain Eb661) TaxID=634500 RepID=D8MXD1_ERWBE|nr:phage polarity suppression protein [Erwinia billingiae]CAX61488.1 Phage polarity suppression protein encoded in CP-933I [Erwinia billingiae Eb661]
MKKPQEALNQYLTAAQEWQTLRSSREVASQQLAALLASGEKPAGYAIQLDKVRERLAVLEWQINCAAREGVYTQGMVLDACVEDGLNAFMADNGSALTTALAPFLIGRGGLEMAARVLRTALARQAEANRPQPAEAYRDIIAGSGLFPDGTMAEDCQQGYTTAQHFRFQRRLSTLDTTKGGA